MEKSIIIILLVLYGVVMLLMCYIDIFKKKKPKNKVHFYVARDMDSYIYLYLGKPLRRNDEFGTTAKCKCIAAEIEFKNFNLDIKDFNNLKWEDEPVEVFLNMGD